MKFFLFSNRNEKNISEYLGQQEYSYWFVQRYFEKFLMSFGETEVLKSLEDFRGTIDDEKILLLFMPPHSVPEDVAHLGIPVIAWEFDTIPDEGWLGNDRNNWYLTLFKNRGALTMSLFVAEEMRKILGSEYPIATIPVPVWDQFSNLFEVPRERPQKLKFHGVVYDSAQEETEPSAHLASKKLIAQNYEICIDGVVYTSVFNPDDGRKEWIDLLSAFIWAHGSNSNTTLILKLILSEGAQSAEYVWDCVLNLKPFQCRVIVIHGYLDERTYEQLISSTTFVVNSSRGEGQCLPLLEFMSAGVPAIAPSHTAMSDYVNSENSLVIQHTREWACWPQDLRFAFRCFTFPVDWNSLRLAYAASYEIALENEVQYESMRKSAYETMEGYCSNRVVLNAFNDFLIKVKAGRSDSSEK